MGEGAIQQRLRQVGEVVAHPHEGQVAGHFRRRGAEQVGIAELPQHVEDTPAITGFDAGQPAIEVSDEFGAAGRAA